MSQTSEQSAAQNKLLRQLGTAALAQRHDASALATLDEGANKTASVDSVDTEWLRFHGLHMLAFTQNILSSTQCEQLRASVTNNIATNALQTSALADLLHQIDQANLAPPLLFKGAALMLQTYQEPWHRPKSDHDLLIDSELVAEYMALFSHLGFEKDSHNAGHYVSYQCSFRKQLAPQVYLYVDLHWRISNRQLLSDVLHWQELRENALAYSLPTAEATPPANSITVYVPSIVDSILLASIHLIGHHFDNVRLVWFLDLKYLYESMSAAQADELLLKAKNKQISGVVLWALQQTERLFGEVLTHKLTPQLEQLQRSSEPSQALLHAEHSRWQLLLWDLKALPTIRAKSQFLWENLFPDLNYLKYEFNTQSALIAQWRRLRRRFTR